ncbi:MBL fold metallo-hydrolase [Microbacter margulisiae]|uniref:Glyoxylase-like metal-dependent hydrolase (Beta-lactamase superfamily II) n=1 Tax=Microbacter margulisiae TaxID=1350067 RepID=A0A7W5GZU9_9PORP|nr:MBL fold metallo-hydrolase [Microbacter margulisiae]MBB3185853.1 glyoxylase-like metal-dependent hydrolase (beta-lactamase superfamily II) [Microbacter margulisiae]
MNIVSFAFNPFMENTYILYDDTSECVIIDAGCLTISERQKLQQLIEKKSLTLKRVINTHLHLDHVFGNGFLFRTYGIAPEAHMADEFLLAQLAAQSAIFGVPFHEDPQPIGKRISENETISFGHTQLRAIHVPGHSPGSLCFYNKKDSVLFVGDVLFRGSIGRTDLPKGNYEELITGIQKKLLILPDETVVYPGHGDPTTIGREKTENPYL